MDIRISRYFAKESNYCHCFLFFACELQVMPHIKKYLTIAKRFPNSCRVIFFRKKSLVLKDNDLIRILIWEQWFDLKDNWLRLNSQTTSNLQGSAKTFSSWTKQKLSSAVVLPTILKSGDLFRMHFCDWATLAYL